MQRRISVKELDAWIKRENIQSIDIAEYLNISPSAISRWRERRLVPVKHQTTLRNIVGLSKSAFQLVNYNES